MSYYDYGGWAPYVSVAKRRQQAEQAAAKLRRQGRSIAAVSVAGRLIGTTFWGRAWCDNLNSYRYYEGRLARGRSCVRNGLVIDLQIAPGRITAMVSGSELYTATVAITQAPKTLWRAICADCAGGIDSLVELLQGRLSNGVMERLCRQQGGLFPLPSDIRFTCSCPDHALMCKHVAAALYGVGARLDHAPELLFRLRAVDAADLVAGLDTALPLTKTGPAAGKALAADDISALFGLDMAPDPVAVALPTAAAAAAGVASPAGRTAKRSQAATPDPAAARPAARHPTAAATARASLQPDVPVRVKGQRLMPKETIVMRQTTKKSAKSG